MASHLLGVLKPAVVFQVNGDAGCSPGVTSDGGDDFWNSRPCINLCAAAEPVSFAHAVRGVGPHQRPAR